MKKTVGVLAIALIALGAGTIHLSRQLDGGRQQIADLQARLKQMEAAQQAAAASFAGQLASLASHDAPPIPAAQGVSTAAQATLPSMPGVSSEVLAAARERAASPEGQERGRALRRLLLVQQHPDLGKELNLSAEEVDKVFDVLVRKELAQQEKATGVLAAGGFAEYMRSVEASKQAAEVELAAMLGGKYPQWQEYQETLPGRQQVNELRVVLSTYGAPLSDAQARPLIAAAAAEQKRMTEESLVPQPGRSFQDVLQQQYSAESTSRLVNAAAPYLNPQQLESYRQMLERDRISKRAAMRIVDETAQSLGETAPPR